MIWFNESCPFVNAYTIPAAHTSLRMRPAGVDMTMSGAGGDVLLTLPQR